MKPTCLFLFAAVATAGATPGMAQELSGACRPESVAPAPADSTLQLDLNLPAYRLDVRSASGLVATFRVAIGSRKYRTPVGRFAVTSVEWNPWWIPPKSEWAKKDTVTPPGPSNPMGRVKLWFGPMYFLHGSPQPQSIGHAASHGCIRLRNGDAVDLATLLLEKAGPDLDAATLSAMRADTQVTRAISLARTVPLTARYDVVEWRHDTLWIHPDVYRRGAPSASRAMGVLAAAGLDTTAISLPRLKAAVKRGSRVSTAVPRDSLRIGPTARGSGVP